MKFPESVLVPAFAGMILLAAGGAAAHGDHDHAAEKQAAPADSAKALAPQEGMKSLLIHLGLMEKEIGAGKLDAIHDHSEALAASVRDLDKDASLTAERKKRVQGYVKNVLKLNDKLHHSAEEKNTEQARKDLAKLQAQVRLLDKQCAASPKP